MSYWVVFVICLSRHGAQCVSYFKTCICLSYPSISKARQHGENVIRFAIINSTYVSCSCSLFQALWLFLKWFWVSAGHFSQECTDVTFAPLLVPCWSSPQHVCTEDPLSGMRCEPGLHGHCPWYQLMPAARMAMLRAPSSTIPKATWCLLSLALPVSCSGTWNSGAFVALFPPPVSGGRPCPGSAEHWGQAKLTVLSPRCSP